MLSLRHCKEVDDGGMVLAFVLLTARRVWVNPKLLQHGQMERSLCLWQLRLHSWLPWWQGTHNMQMRPTEISSGKTGVLANCTLGKGRVEGRRGCQESGNSLWMREVRELPLQKHLGEAKLSTSCIGSRQPHLRWPITSPPRSSLTPGEWSG